MNNPLYQAQAKLKLCTNTSQREYLNDGEQLPSTQSKERLLAKLSELSHGAGRRLDALDISD